MDTVTYQVVTQSEIAAENEGEVSAVPFNVPDVTSEEEVLKPVTKGRKKSAKKVVEKAAKTAKTKTAKTVKTDSPTKGDEVVQIVPSGKKDWFILKVQVNREEYVKDALLRNAAMQGLRDFFGEILIPTEKVTEFRNGQKKVTKKKLYPGYLMMYMEITEASWMVVRETYGVADFTGALGKPTPMSADEVARIMASEHEVASDSAPKLKVAYQVGDKIKVKDGTFENFEGEVHQIDVSNGRVTVMLTIFGRSTPVEVEYWQIEHPK